MQCCFDTMDATDASLGNVQHPNVAKSITVSSLPFHRNSNGNKGIEEIKVELSMIKLKHPFPRLSVYIPCSSTTSRWDA